MFPQRRFEFALLTLCLLFPLSIRSEEEDKVDVSRESLEEIDTTTTDVVETTAATATLDVNEENDFEQLRPQLREIYTLDDNCVKNYCYHFNYDHIDEVAFFDVKTEIRINSDATYDIVNAHNYDTLIFENSTFVHFPLHLFYSVEVKELDLRNCSIQFMTWECFLMAQKLRILLLSHNRLQTINQSTFKFAADLQYLFLDSNRLTQLHDNSFDGLAALRYLDLRHNQLTQLPDGVFDPLSALQELHLDNNRLRVLSNGMFTNNPNLMTLTISANRLQHIDDNALRPQTRLIIFDISHNYDLRTLVMMLQLNNLVSNNCMLTRINIYGHVRNADLSNNRILELYFARPELLQSLNLRNNSLEQIASLTRATHLLELDLCDNPNLGAMPSPWLANSLERLNLGNTGLNQLPVEAIAEQSQLRFLNVSYNQLREINPHNFKYLEHLTHFDIRGNNWNCYNLNLLMDFLLQPHNIAHGHDDIDPEFPGEYINDIACMYRIEDEQETPDVKSNREMDGMAKYAVAELQNYPEEEWEAIRREVKAIVGIYERKFNKAFQMIDNLNARLTAFERINETLFQHMTITV